MGRITSGVGLVSGINSKDIIDQLMTLESQPKTRLEDRIEETNKVKLAYTDLSTRLTSLKLSSTVLKKSTTFQAATTQSGDDDVLTATASNGAAIGNYQFQVARLVTTQQSVSGGFNDATTAKIGAGTLTIEQGGGELTNDPTLSQLNGGAGVRRGLFRITDRAGKSSVIDITSAVSVGDVVKKINTSLDISVRAQVKGDGIILTDLSGAAISNFTVQDVGGGSAAADLGIAANVAAGTINGTDVYSLGSRTLLENTNDGRGVRRAATGADFEVDVGGIALQVTLGPDVTTIGDVVHAINAVGGVEVQAEVAPNSDGIRLVDVSGGARVITVTALNDSKAASDLGILTGPPGAAGAVQGKPLLGGLNSVLLSSLNGGAGLTLGNITIVDRGGADRDIDLSSATTVEEVLDIINQPGGVAVTAQLKKSGNGIELIDTSGGTGNIIVTDSGGANPATASALGIAGTFAPSSASVQGANLQRQWITENTLLSNYNGGKGVARGSFKITNAAGGVATIELGDTDARLSDVIAKINAKGIDVTASINAKGDGLLLTDASAGGGKMKVEETNSTTARDLNILGAADLTPTIDGSFERTITVTADDTLTTLQQKITEASAGVSAAIVNDGSGASPFRLSLTSRNTGRTGRVVIDSGNLTNLQTANLVESQDAAVFVGSADAADPLLVTGTSNQIAGVIKGVTLDLHGVSSKPVSLSVSRTPDAVIEEVKKFADNFNELVDKIKEYTKFDTETNQRGLLLGDTTVQTVEQNIYEIFGTAVSSGGKVRVAADVGLKLVDGAKLEFDETKFLEAFASDPEAVGTLFSKLPSNLSTETPLTKLNSGRGIRTTTVGADFEITTKDGTKTSVTLGSDIASFGELLNKINTAGAGKFTAEIGANGASIQINDITVGTGTLTLLGLNGSPAVTDLGLPSAGADGVLIGRTILPPSPTTRLNEGSGLGHLLENSLSRLIDPVDGTITKENQQLDVKNQQFQSRIDALDKLIESKRARLERQFSQMESVLANLQSQQSALGTFQSLPALSSR